VKVVELRVVGLDPGAHGADGVTWYRSHQLSERVAGHS
jgi:hypothetical protein